MKILSKEEAHSRMSKQNSSVLVVGKTIYRRITEFINQGKKHRDGELGILDSHMKYACNTQV